MPRSDRSVSFLKFTVSKSQLSPLGFSEMYTDEVLSVELSGIACHRQATEWGPIRPFQMGITPSPSEQTVWGYNGEHFQSPANVSVASNLL